MPVVNAEDRRSWAWVIAAGPGALLVGRGAAAIIRAQGWPQWLTITLLVAVVIAGAAVMYLLLPARSRYLVLRWKKARR